MVGVVSHIHWGDMSDLLRILLYSMLDSRVQTRKHNPNIWPPYVRNHEMETIITDIFSAEKQKQLY